MNETELQKWMHDEGYVERDGQWFKHGDPRLSRPIVQEPKARVRKKTGYTTRCKIVDEILNRRYRITITLRYSDLRLRDPDGAASTILDCLVTARRQLESHTRKSPLLQNGSEG